MTDLPAFSAPPAGGDYCGRILRGPFSRALKARVRDCIAGYRFFDSIDGPSMIYIAAWQGSRQTIWYEYAGRRLVELLDCGPGEAAWVLRRRVIDRRIYTGPDRQRGVRKEVRSRVELAGTRERLREEGRRTGCVEAVYQVAMEAGSPIWLKDQAVIEEHPADGVCLSLGQLTEVSKEMEAEEALKRHHDRLETVVAERTAELTRLNAQLRTEIAERQQAEFRLQHSYRRLQQNLDEMIRAMSSTVEERDPYTAGHQRRATELATALARELGLSEQATKGLQMAGLIHDLGKISIPAEILSKPGKLNAAEIQLIRRHPRVAFDILREIDFPWPVDRIVLQHHERLDGSGYPQGLAGEAILREARILSVADVVETIESHRPYRPGRGREEALEEIARNRGRLYDAEVVDACLRLFREKNFQYH
jgi:HD-GYP domain-containing protein (c-di-GMP phosphodiesterase class II)